MMSSFSQKQKESVTEVRNCWNHGQFDRLRRIDRQYSGEFSNEMIILCEIFDTTCYNFDTHNTFV